MPARLVPWVLPSTGRLAMLHVLPFQRSANGWASDAVFSLSAMRNSALPIAVQAVRDVQDTSLRKLPPPSALDGRGLGGLSVFHLRPFHDWARVCWPLLEVPAAMHQVGEVHERSARVVAMPEVLSWVTVCPLNRSASGRDWPRPLPLVSPPSAMQDAAA